MDRDFENLISQRGHWTLQNDVKLCTMLDEIQQDLTKRCKEIEAKCKLICTTSAKTEASIQNMSLQLTQLANRKFVDTKILDEDPVIMRRKRGAPRDSTKRTREEEITNSLNAIKAATHAGMQLVNCPFSAKEKFLPLPPFIGSNQFKIWQSCDVPEKSKVTNEERSLTTSTTPKLSTDASLEKSIASSCINNDIDHAIEREPFGSKTLETTRDPLIETSRKKSVQEEIFTDSAEAVSQTIDSRDSQKVETESHANILEVSNDRTSLLNDELKRRLLNKFPDGIDERSIASTPPFYQKTIDDKTTINTEPVENVAVASTSENLVSPNRKPKVAVKPERNITKAQTSEIKKPSWAKKNLFDFDSDDDLFSEYAKVLSDSRPTADRIMSQKPSLSTATPASEQKNLLENIGSITSNSMTKERVDLNSKNRMDETLSSKTENNLANQDYSVTPTLESMENQQSASSNNDILNDTPSLIVHSDSDPLQESILSREIISRENSKEQDIESMSNIRNKLEKLPMFNPSTMPIKNVKQNIGVYQQEISEASNDTETSTSSLLISVNKTRAKGPSRRPPSKISNSVSIPSENISEISAFVSSQNTSSPSDTSEDIPSSTTKKSSPQVNTINEKMESEQQNIAKFSIPSSENSILEQVRIQDQKPTLMIEKKVDVLITNNTKRQKVKSLFDSDSDDDDSLFRSSVGLIQPVLPKQVPAKAKQESTKPEEKTKEERKIHVGNSKYSNPNKSSIFDWDSDDEDMSLFRK